MSTAIPPAGSQEQPSGTGQAPTSTAPTPQAGGESTAPTMTLEEAQAALKAARHDAASYRTRLANLEKTQTEAEAAKLAEQGRYKELAEQAQAETAALKAQLAAKDHADLQREVAAEHKLPPEMATRLQGADRAELTADAKQLAKVFPPAPTGGAPGSVPSPRPGAQPSKTLIEQETERLRASGKYSRG